MLLALGKTYLSFLSAIYRFAISRFAIYESTISKICPWSGITRIRIKNGLENICLFVFLFAAVLIVNEPSISFQMIYQEQASIYLANQTIANWHDLLNIYLHPTWLHINIPFFRPSGHFLIYQVLTPLLGWHNIKAFTIVNLFFLAATGFFLIKIYKLLFPNFSSGAFIAFSLYLMHPCMSVSRLTIMHFDFAYIAFLTMSLYLFILFCHSLKLQESSGSLKSSHLPSSANHSDNQHGAVPRYSSKHPYYFNYLFAFSILFYAIAISFKEPAIMLGPVMFCYYCISRYSNQSGLQYIRDIICHKQSLLILSMLIAASAALSWYLFLSWPSINYASHSFNLQHTLGAANAFFKDILALDRDLLPFGVLLFKNYAWRTTVFTPASRYIIWLFFWITVVCAIIIYKKRKIGADKINPPETNSLKIDSLKIDSLKIESTKSETLAYQKSFLFVFISSLLFTILPLAWAAGGPWHYNLTFLCYCLMMGFSAEYFMRRLKIKPGMLAVYCGLISSIIAFVGITVNIENITKYKKIREGFLGMALNRNAILSPPPIKNQINKDSILVVEDSSLHNDYFLGNSAYPLLLSFNNKDYDNFQEREKHFYISFQSTYSGNLFRYAFLMPSLKEELYPFKIEEMNAIPNEIIYNWLKHFNNIFCLGYDFLGNWQDKTSAFKKNLLDEQAARGMILHHYQIATKERKEKILAEQAAYTSTLAFPDEQLCEYTCDQDKQCKGLVYQYSKKGRHHDIQCHYYRKT
jgi:hypothetical protein